MLGIKDPGIYIVYILTLLSAGLCVWYGIKNWNVGADTEAQEIVEETKWEEKDKKVAKA